MIQEILPGFFEIRTSFANGFVNTYLVVRGHQALLVDSGPHQAASALFSFLRKLGLAEKQLRYLINTHSHPNHVGANGAIQARSHCEIIAHPKAVRWIENPEHLLEEVYNQFGAFWPVSDAFKRDFFEAIGEPARVSAPADFRQPLGRPGFEDVRLVPLPGHQQDCLGVFFPDEGVLIAGDAIQRRGVGPHFQQYDDRQNYLRSLQDIRDLKPEWLLTAHFSALNGTKAEEFLNQSEAAVWEIDYRIAMVKQQLGENAPLWDVALAIHKGMEKELGFSGLLTIRAHLREEEKSKYNRSDASEIAS